jgi:hypothetical protein
MANCALRKKPQGQNNLQTVRGMHKDCSGSAGYYYFVFYYGRAPLIPMPAQERSVRYWLKGLEVIPRLLPYGLNAVHGHTLKRNMV